MNEHEILQLGAQAFLDTYVKQNFHSLVVQRGDKLEMYEVLPQLPREAESAWPQVRPALVDAINREQRSRMLQQLNARKSHRQRLLTNYETACEEIGKKNWVATSKAKK